MRALELKMQGDVYRRFTRGQRVCASVLVVIWGVAFFMIATLAGISVMTGLGLVLGHFDLKSELYLDIAGVISGAVFFLALVFLLRCEKRREFILRTSMAAVHRFGQRDEHKA